MRVLTVLLLMLSLLPALSSAPAPAANGETMQKIPNSVTTAISSPPPAEASVMMISGTRAHPWQPTIFELEHDPAEVHVSPVPGGYGATAPVQSMANGDAIQIRLLDHWFDPLARQGPIPKPLLADTVRAGDKDYVLVQFHGPILPRWRTLIEASGGEVLDYVPDFAFIVRIGAGQRDILAAQPEVRWIDRFPPAFRLSGELADMALRGQPNSGLAMMVRGFAGEPEGPLSEALQRAGAQIVSTVADSGGGAVFRVQAKTSNLLDLARIAAVAWIEIGHPSAFGNAVARSNNLIGKDAVEAAVGFYGQGQIVAVADSGLSTGNATTMHPDFAGRVLGWGTGPNANCTGWADDLSHGTHVAGSVLGSGVSSGANIGANQFAGSHAGIAPRASLVVWAGCDDMSGIPIADMYSAFFGVLHQVDPELRVVNNSWGQIEPQTFGTYNITARETDRFIRDFPDMVGVFITQNIGRDATASGVADMGTATPPGTAKNIISVGASESLRVSGGWNPGSPICSNWGNCFPGLFPTNPINTDTPSDNGNGIAAFSGRGPTLSNRLKPDIVAPGTNIVSARNESHQSGSWGPYDNFYMYAGGTSMAAPLVAGGAAVVREYFQRQFNHNPSAALVKGVLIHGARDLSPGQHGTGPQQEVWRRPDINQGWGRMDLPKSLIFEGTRQPAYFEVSTGLQTSQALEQTIDLVSDGAELRVTLVWTDVHGMEASHGALVNDLDLQLVDPHGTVHNGSAGMINVNVDRFNNFEEVRIASAPAGTYTLRVVGFNVPQGPQPFSVVLTGALPGDSLFGDRFQILPKPVGTVD